MTQIDRAFTLFVSSLVESFPFLLWGILISSGLLVFVDEQQFARRFPRQPFLAVLVGSGLGLLLPVFQYGNVPVARRLLLQGVPVPAAISFLVAAPTINIITLALTWLAFPQRPEILLLRVAFTILIAGVIGLIFSNYRQKRSLLPGEETAKQQECSALLQSGSWLVRPTPPDPENLQLHRVGKLHYGYLGSAGVDQSFAQRLQLFLENTVKELLELGAILVVGCAIATGVQLFFPQGQILAWAQTPVTRILALMLLATVLSLGSLADTFFAYTLTASFTSGSILSFLLWGGIFDIKILSLILSSFRWRPVFYLSILALQLTFLLALLVDFYI